MADFDRPRRGHGGADLAQGRLQLVDEEIDHVGRSRLPERAKTPQEGLAGEGRDGAERQRAADIDTGAYSGIHQHRGPAGAISAAASMVMPPTVPSV